MYKFLGVLTFAAALVACGGGGGSGLPGPQPTPTPHSQKASLSIVWHGGASLASLASMLRHTETTQVTVLPVTLSVSAPAQSFFGGDLAQSSGTASVEVSPAPTSVPAVNISVSGVEVTDTPQPNPSPGNIPFTVQSTQASTPASGSLTATVPAVGSQTVNLYQFPRANIAGGATPVYGVGPGTPVIPSDQWGGITFVNGVAQQANSPSNADFYMDCAWCTATGFQNGSDANPVIYAPFGAVAVSSMSTAFTSLSPSQWSNSFTSETLASLITGLTEPTPLDELLIKTADGHVVALAINEANGGVAPSGGGNGSPATMNFIFQEDGFSQDGF